MNTGRWKGALVAIKIVEHSAGDDADVIEGARESLLAASVSHPNVVACYKICTGEALLRYCIFVRGHEVLSHWSPGRPLVSRGHLC